MKKYELIDHTADIGLRIFGQDLSDLFQNAGYALFDVITDISKVSPRQKRRFNLQRDCMEELLVEWLSSLLYVFDTEQLLFSSFQVFEISDTRLEAEAAGELYNKDFHPVKTEVKAVTYHNLNITEVNGVWQATTVLDI
jgi:SHS2 domain-containing protein